MSTIYIDKIWVLRLGNFFLGIEPKALKEVLEVTQPTPVPLAPPPLLGLLSNQGQIVPIFDLSQVLQVLSTGSGLAALLEVEGQAIAFTVDEVAGLRANLSGARVTPSQEPLFSAVLEDGGQSIGVLNPKGLLEYLITRMSTPTPPTVEPAQSTPLV